MASSVDWSGTRMDHHAIAVYVGEQLICVPPYQINEYMFIVVIVYN